MSMVRLLGPHHNQRSPCNIATPNIAMVHKVHVASADTCTLGCDNDPVQEYIIQRHQSRGDTDNSVMQARTR